MMLHSKLSDSTQTRHIVRQFLAVILLCLCSRFFIWQWRYSEFTVSYFALYMSTSGRYSTISLLEVLNDDFFVIEMIILLSA